MDQKKTVQEEIEESLRICEEILNENPDIIPPKPDIDVEEILRNTEHGYSYTEDAAGQKENEAVRNTEGGTAGPEETQAVQNIRPLEIKHEEDGLTAAGEKKEKKPENVPVSDVKTRSRKRSAARTLISILVCVVIAVAAAILITHFVANHTTVEGNSMEPCLGNGDELIVEKVSYLTEKPERFDVVVFKFNENTNYIKRIIGLPGEKVRIEEGKIYINDKAIFDEHANGVMEEAGIAEKTVTLGNDEYFVLGDNRNASKDSRHKDVGTVKADQIIGKAWLRMMPFDDFGFIK